MGWSFLRFAEALENVGEKRKMQKLKIAKAFS